jgi:hypothetical protein
MFCSIGEAGFRCQRAHYSIGLTDDMPASAGNPINIPRKAIPFVYGEVGANPGVSTDARMSSKPAPGERLLRRLAGFVAPS